VDHPPPVLNLRSPRPPLIPVIRSVTPAIPHFILGLALPCLPRFYTHFRRFNSPPTEPAPFCLEQMPHTHTYTNVNTYPDVLTRRNRYPRFQNLESQEKKHTMHKDTLNREHRYLRRRLEQLTATVNVNKRRSVSESSNYTTASGASTTSSACSTSSSPSISESGTCNVPVFKYVPGRVFHEKHLGEGGDKPLPHKRDSVRGTEGVV